MPPARRARLLTEELSFGLSLYIESCSTSAHANWVQESLFLSSSFFSLVLPAAFGPRVAATSVTYIILARVQRVRRSNHSLAIGHIDSRAPTLEVFLMSSPSTYGCTPHKHCPVIGTVYAARRLPTVVLLVLAVHAPLDVPG